MKESLGSQFSIHECEKRIPSPRGRVFRMLAGLWIFLKLAVAENPGFGRPEPNKVIPGLELGF